jgi:hypothetical protein
MKNILMAGSTCDAEHWNLRVEPSSGLRLLHYTRAISVEIFTASANIFWMDIPPLTGRATCRAMMWANMVSLQFGFGLMLLGWLHAAANVMTRINMLGMATASRIIHD